MSLKPVFIFLSLLSSSFNGVANTKLIDSLRMMYYLAESVPEKRELLVALTDNSRMMPIDSHKLYVQELKELSGKNAGKEDRLIADLSSSFLYIRTGRLDSFLYYYKTNEEELKNYPKLRVKFLNYYGQYFVKKNMHEEAFSKFYACLKLAEAERDTMFIINSRLGIGWTYMEMNQMEEAVSWFKNALGMTSERKFQIMFPTIYTNLGSCFGSLGKFDSSRYYCNKALELSIENNDLASQANANFILGNLYMVSAQFYEAEKVFMEGYRIHKVIGDPFYIVSDMAEIAIHYAHTKQYEKGIVMAQEAIEYAEKNNLDAKLPLCYDALASNYKLSGEITLYAATLAKMNVLKDSMYKKTSELAVAEMNTKYESAKKEKIIQEQLFEISKRNYFLFGGTGIFMLAGLLGFVLYRNRTHQQEKKMQLELMRQQDIASEAVIEAEENERRRIAADLHDGIGQMLTAVKLNLEGLTDRIMINNPEDSAVYEKVKIMLEESCREVRNVSHNIMPNALIKQGLGNAVKDFIDKVNSDRLHIQLSLSGINHKLSSNVEIVVYRVIQECVNNVIKHSQASNLDISISNDEEGLNVTIEDNGKGFNVSTLEHAKGIGMRNVRTRVEYLKGILDIDSKPGKGTLVAFHIPAVNT